MKLRALLQRLTCLHRWSKKEDTGYGEYGKGYLWKYTCDECNKVVYRWGIQGDPISGLLPKDPWEEYKKDPAYNLSPPYINLDK